VTAKSVFTRFGKGSTFFVLVLFNMDVK